MNSTFIIMFNQIISYVSLHFTSGSSVAMGASTGAIYYTFTEKTRSKSKTIALFIISFMTGIISAEFAANFLSAITPSSVVAEASFGAMISSALCIKILKAIGNNINDFVARFKES
ncbi:putative holin [Serratia sp. M24T3]|uniref:putative holin n=1 Tax=Serratia sp. M24T3 TaxID=932213 RepID=UPI0009FD0630|nr:putative holin [Serratia sp. M24T3]